ncbi:AfsR/SARP family transcriptional regulator [Crossiella cryophila]|uniref:DNA-binding SARP family transcriptional activator n=1 Tax=Crossiella cryophila TaxID=43355 RepID=A0A7W7FW55_9PSEU|nr:BTAD domain-containing putative transcriptional regulator [Crossiella cryophila]MBB4679912.1 DNA-binding SARP family transcriptional activator [Crossiella cryophila]
MRFRVLGALELPLGVRPVRAGYQRGVLALLLLRHNSVVATGELLGALWPGNRPRTARKMLQNAVCGLRSALAAEAAGPGSPLLLTHPPGYLLRVAEDDLDLVRFRRLTRRGRAELAAGEPLAAAGSLWAAAALWRGPALSDLPMTRNWPEVAGLRQEFLSTMEDWAVAELCAGGQRRVADELEPLVRAEPTRERLCVLLMRGLYAAGRQADALAAGRRSRIMLAERLGLRPGPELRDTELAILRHELPPLPGR